METSAAPWWVQAALAGLNIEGNTIYALASRVFSGPTTGTVQNNYVYGTKGWVLEGGNLTFTGNTWGTGANANVYDIAILAFVRHGVPDIVAMSNANNGAVIEDQRVSPAVLSVVNVDDGAPVCGDCGGLQPYQTIAPAITRVVAGGTIKVAAGYVPSTQRLIRRCICWAPKQGIPSAAGQQRVPASLRSRAWSTWTPATLWSMASRSPTPGRRMRST